MFLSAVAHLDVHCHQIDVKTAFLNCVLDRDVFMEQPEGCIDERYPDRVFKLHKVLYGSKQASRLYYSKINSFLIELGFQSSPYDPCLYARKAEEEIVLISLYVDDLLLSASDLNLLIRLKSEFCNRFKI